MQIFVKTVAGNSRAIDLVSGSSIETLQSQVCDVTGVPAEEQVLSCAGALLFSTAGLAAGETILCGLRLLGAGKKRKKKVYNTPKKIPHKHAKVKLRVLNYYQVDSASGKVTRLRRECPAPECGAGVYMGKHADRQTCGSCGLSFRYEQAADE
eukprot:c39273_g1_i1.p2 GENE.c39273_g1_i1~~c39273_g1_i1.p2  ORF type:complete len:153 (-),score=34.03 c39273_g1_i1:29-487(-)